MLKDPLQERLRKMEDRNPSSNMHPKSFLDSIIDKSYFLQRYFAGSVQEYTAEQRTHDILLRAKAEADLIMFYKQSVGPKELAQLIEDALLYREMGLKPRFEF